MSPRIDRPRTHRAAMAILRGVSISVALGLVFGAGTRHAAFAQTVGSARDQPTPATLPPRSENAGGSANKPVGEVSPPSAIAASTAVTASDRKGKVVRTNPLDHLPQRDRAGTGGRNE